MTDSALSSTRLAQHSAHLTNPAPSSNMAPQSDITLYTDATPNGIKITIALEELGLPYKTEHLDISTNKQKEVSAPRRLGAETTSSSLP